MIERETRRFKIKFNNTFIRSEIEIPKTYEAFQKAIATIYKDHANNVAKKLQITYLDEDGDSCSICNNDTYNEYKQYELKEKKMNKLIVSVNELPKKVQFLEPTAPLAPSTTTTTPKIKKPKVDNNTHYCDGCNEEQQGRVYRKSSDINYMLCCTCYKYRTHLGIQANEHFYETEAKKKLKPFPMPPQPPQQIAPLPLPVTVAPPMRESHTGAPPISMRHIMRAKKNKNRTFFF